MKKLLFLLIISIRHNQASLNPYNSLTRHWFALCSPMYNEPEIYIEWMQSLFSRGTASENQKHAKKFEKNLECNDILYCAHFRERLEILLAQNPNLITEKQKNVLHAKFFDTFCQIMINDHKEKIKYPWAAVLFDSLELIDIVGDPLFSQAVQKYKKKSSPPPVLRSNSAPAALSLYGPVTQSKKNLYSYKIPSLLYLSLKKLKNDIKADIEDYKNMMDIHPVGNIMAFRNLFFECLCEISSELLNNREKQKKLAEYFSPRDLITLIREYLVQDERSGSKIGSPSKRRHSTT